jgi:hypothetical protein
VGTGLNSGTYYQDLWEWDQASNTWAQKANLPASTRYGAVAFSIGTEGFLGTGMNGPYFNDFWQWNQVTNGWTQKTNFPGGGRNYASGFSCGNKGYLGLGRDLSTDKTDLWEYTPDSIATGTPETGFATVSVSVYPNPFSTYTTFAFSSAPGPAVLTVCDLQGKEVKELIIAGSAEQFVLEREGMDNGIYFYRITSGNDRIATGKLIIQ